MRQNAAAHCSFDDERCRQVRPPTLPAGTGGPCAANPQAGRADARNASSTRYGRRQGSAESAYSVYDRLDRVRSNGPLNQKSWLTSLKQAGALRTSLGNLSLSRRVPLAYPAIWRAYRLCSPIASKFGPAAPWRSIGDLTGNAAFSMEAPDFRTPPGPMRGDTPAWSPFCDRNQNNGTPLRTHR